MSNLVNIVGLWKSEGIEGESRVLTEEIVFFDDQFIFIQRDQTALPVGVESGSFAIRESGNIDLEVEFDGLWRSNGARDGFDNGPPMINLPLSFNADATFMTLDSAWDFSRIDVLSNKQAIHGVWSVGQTDDLEHDNTTYLVFLESGTFLSATPTDQVSFSNYTGLEIGSYAVSNNGARLSLTYSYDGTSAARGSSGFSAAGLEFDLRNEGAGVRLSSLTSGIDYLLSNVFGSDNSTEPAESLDDGNYSITIVVELFDQVFLLKDLNETINDEEHTITYEDKVYSYEEVEPFMMVVSRDGEFTAEFSSEIAESFPSSAGVSYSVALGIIGVSDWEQTLLGVAGADGNYIG